MSTSAEKTVFDVALKTAAGVNYEQLLKLVPFGQSKFQTETFLTEQHRTPHRQLRQVLLQYDQLCHTLLSAQSTVRKAQLDKEERDNKIERLQHEIENGDLDKFAIRDRTIQIARVQIELDDVAVSRAQSEKMVTDALAEKDTLEGLLNKIVPEVMALEAQGMTFDKSEKDYWRVRFVEDIRLSSFVRNTGGAIDKEILRAVMQMEKADRKDVFVSLGFTEDAIAQMDLIGSDSAGLAQVLASLPPAPVEQPKQVSASPNYAQLNK